MTATKREDPGQRRAVWPWRRSKKREPAAGGGNHNPASDSEESLKTPARWSLGILNDRETDEVPGSVLLLSKASDHNEPLGLRNAPARTSASSLPSPYPYHRRESLVSQAPEKKRTSDGILLEPQPDESLNDPLNWPKWRRDCALLSLGFYCMLGGGMTPILAAGFSDVSKSFGVSVPKVALTTGLFMMGMGLGSVVFSPTAILYGKRPVYLATSILFVLTAVWCALSPNYASLVVARVCMGFAVSPVECLPSATVAEIFFLHERAYRLGIYTLLLLGGKNLIPLVAAAIVETLGWRWIFWIVAIVVGFGGCLLFLFVPETFWDRTPTPSKHKSHHYRPRLGSNVSKSFFSRNHASPNPHEAAPELEKSAAIMPVAPPSVSPGRPERHAHFSEPDDEDAGSTSPLDAGKSWTSAPSSLVPQGSDDRPDPDSPLTVPPASEDPFAAEQHSKSPADTHLDSMQPSKANAVDASHHDPPCVYTSFYRAAPPKSYVETLRPYAGRLSKDSWLRVAIRPFILYAYPAIIWSSLVYALSVGWLIVLSESVSTIYESRSTYNFTSLQAGLVYVSPFIGGILGTAVAGKVSDIIVRFMSRRNGGVYEPEFRLVMAIPVALSTTIGLMGYGWSAQERDSWIVPTVFFGIISFGCSLGSTTAITFAVDSYRQYAGEALVTLNFSKNIFHGLVFSLFFSKWLESDGSKTVFLALGGIQIACLLTSIPMYIYGKRARMWTVRKNLMEKF